MDATQIITLYLRRHPRYVHTLAVFGDPDDNIAAQLEWVPFGARVRLVVTPFGADPPMTYNYAWSGHLNAWGYELAAKQKNGAWS